jgi:hypothetical protein
LTQIGAICSANNGQRKKIDFDWSHLCRHRFSRKLSNHLAENGRNCGHNIGPWIESTAMISWPTDRKMDF